MKLGKNGNEWADGSVVFSSDHYEENRFEEKDLIKLVPYAVSLTQDPNRPTLLLKDEFEKYTLPVALNPLEAGVALSQSSQGSVPHTPHRVTELLLNSLNIKIERCVFVEIKSHSQFVRLYFDNHPGYGSLKVRADEAMSLCLHLGVPLFATKELISKSRVMSAEVSNLVQGLALNPGLLQKSHQYIQ